VVSLVAKILPPVPSEAAVPSTAPSSVAAVTAAAAAAAQQGGKDVAAEQKAAQAQRVQFLQQNPALLEKFSRDLLPPLLHVSTCCQLLRVLFLSPHCRLRPLDHVAGLSQRYLSLCQCDQAASMRVQVYASTVQQQVRTQVLTSISRMVYYNSPEMLRCVLSHPSCAPMPPTCMQ
jgi:hypothetical protein